MILDGQTLTRWEITVESNRGKKKDCVFSSPHDGRKVRTWTRVHVGKRGGIFNANILSLSRSALSHGDVNFP